MVRVRTGVFAVLVLALAMASSANAQQVFGSIFGTVTDASGAAVANAKLTITDTSKGTTFVVTTDASGNYLKGQLIPDPYKISIEASGFQKVVSDIIPVRVDESARFDAALKVGDVTTEVEVSAAAPLLQADRADVAQTFTAKEIQELPNIGRNVQSMTLLEPGSAKIGWQHASDENPQNSIQMVVNGLLFSQMGYELDGTTNQDPILGIIVINPTLESLSEVKQATQNYDAEFSFVGGGTASYSTKSGTNEYHGAAFENLQLNTPGFVTFAANPFTGLPPAVYRQNQFGGAIGGPIKKNKLFFFGDAQLNRQAQGGSIVASVPSALNRGGNFSDWTTYNTAYQIYDPTTGNADGTGRTPYHNNTIPTSQLSKQAANIMAYFPASNFTQTANTPFVNNYAVNGDVNITGNAWNTREDYYLNDKNTIFGRYSYAAFTEQAPGAFGALAGGPTFVNYAGNSQALNQSLALGWTDTISPTLINEFRFGYMRYHVFDVPNGYGTQPATAAGIPNLNLDTTYTSGLPFFNINNPAGSSMQLGYALGTNQCNCPLTQTETQYQFIDNLSKTVGKHTIKVGADIRFANNLRVPSDVHRAGELNFNSAVTGIVTTAGQGTGSSGIGLATFMLGDVSTFGRYVSTSTNATEHQPRLFWYGTDEYRPTSKLTLNMGLRWEMVFPESTAPGNGATYDQANGLMYVFGQGGVSNHGIQTMNWHDFAPRFGAAYQIDTKTVIRAGFGWGYDLGVFGSTFGHNVTQNPPVLTNQSINPSNGFQDVFTLAQGPPAPSTQTVSSNGTFPLPANVSPKYRPATVTLPQVYLFNITGQRQLTNKIAVSAGYVGNMSRHGFIGGSGQTVNPNEAVFIPGATVGPANYPYYGFAGNTGLSYYCDCSNSDYNSFQATVKMNAWEGLNLQGSYTYQRQYGDGFGYDGNYYFMYGPRAQGQGYTNTLPRQQYTFAETYDVPFGKGRKYGADSKRAVDLALGGWTLSGITTYYSGFPFSPTLENYGPGGGQPNAGPNNRPTVGSGSPYSSQANRNQWIVGIASGAYGFPSPNSFGNYPINTLFGPRFIQQDMSMMKSFQITEKINFQLRTDARNVFNHTNLGLPNSDVQSPNVGLITGLAGGAYMRSLQFSGTIRF